MAKDKNNKQNRSMFLYTALIFVVALILIIIAFFGQKNIRELRERARNTTGDPVVTQNVPSDPAPDDLALTANALAAAQSENDSLKARLSTYDKLLDANAKASAGNYGDAQIQLSELSYDDLNNEQKVLFDQINEKINNGKEQ